ncbi:hypothetical protein VHEMI01900 [[Torrubiella] hemipterigena]|uniref:Pentatricopeptide repeat protein n=1 Tax=[Torrubiella] hemipterigena TaxID=1531966 RepID=A0A0A1T8T7_9HYPO|nr:hypothetical protein VHEMI01900 [[Torrubiella] hemipterigena]
MMNPTRIEGSICGAVLSKRSVAAWKVAAACPASGQRSLSSKTIAPGIGPKPQEQRLNACTKSSAWILSTFAPGVQPHRLPTTARLSLRNARFSSTQSTAPPEPNTTSVDTDTKKPSYIQTKQQILSYVAGVPTYANVDEQFDFHRDPYRRGYANPQSPGVQISDRKNDIQYPSAEETAKATDEIQEVIAKLCAAIRQRMRQPRRTSLSAIYKLYCQLPEPRMLYLTWQWRTRLMKVMGTPRTKSKSGMVRYFELVSDIRDAGLTMRLAEWNYGLAFASSYASKTTSYELETTLKLWREMEKEHGLPGNDVTFNILFDVAAKAGNYDLADMIYQEMENRGIDFNRYHHVSLIHFFGLKLDADGLRSAYKEMVESGEMIDTVVLNCVIAGLLRCGEEMAAEYTYERMKQGHVLAPDMPERDYMLGRVITKVLMMFTKIGKVHPQIKDSLQTNVLISPDIHTYRLLIEHYAIRVGDIGKVAQYLDEMKALKIPVHATIFLALFKGFFSYGGYEGSLWSEQRLQDVLNALYLARDEETSEFFIDTWVVIWALRAVKKCSSIEAVIDTFAALEKRWDVVPDRQVYMHEIFDNILRDRDVHQTWLELDSSKTRSSRMRASLNKMIDF